MASGDGLTSLGSRGTAPAVSPAGAEARALMQHRNPLPVPAMEFLDLRTQFAGIREEVMAAVARVLESQRFILGDEVRLFEEELAGFLGVQHAITCASGSDALVLALMALEIGRGDEVITTPFTFGATAGSIARTGAKPVFVDIDPATFNLQVSAVESAITSRTKAILPVHLYGLATDLATLRGIADSRGIAVIEDAAQAIGARCDGKAAGTWGEFGCFSFFPSKNLGGAGDGGLVTTGDPALADLLRILRVHGSRTKYSYERLGLNSRLDALQAAILRVKLRSLAEWTGGRRNRAERYRRLFEESDLLDQITLPFVPAECHHVYNQFTIRCDQRDGLRQFLRSRGVPTEVYYPEVLHVQPAFSYLECRRGQFPNAEEACNEVLSLPVYSELRDDQQDAVVEAIAEFYEMNA